MPELKTKTIINILLVVVLILGLYYAFLLPTQLGDYAISITATVLGLMLAFYFNKRQEEINNERERKQFLDDVKTELQYDIELLTGNGNIVKTEIWNSGLLTSINLLEKKQKQIISELYHDMENFVYEAKRTRDIAEKFRGLPKANINTDSEWIQVGKQWDISTKNMIEIENRLKDKIKSVLSNEEIWK